ncbi:MAG: hypothetical protein K2K15_04070 [Anaeroplasmataceae bacterium]|nr:hypothetical protein [Anaeroplasmataceae bacterium]
MGEEKKSQIRRSLEFAKEELETLKATNPDGNYEQLEKMIEKLNDILEGVNQKRTTLILLLKYFILLVLSYLVCGVGVMLTFGFGRSFLNDIPATHFITIIPLVTLALFLALRITSFVSNSHSLWTSLICFIMIVILMGFVDGLWLHICKSMDKSFAMVSLLAIITILGDLYFSKKIYFIL